jgi:hypothetical protein
MPSLICRKTHIRAAVAFLICALVLTAGMSAQSFSPTDGMPCVDPKTLSGQELRMFGRLLSAVEDLGGGYYNEARGKYEKIIHDLGKTQYSPCLRWMAYDGYGQSLIGVHKREKAVAALTQAVDEAKALNDAQRSASKEHLQSAQQMK